MFLFCCMYGSRVYRYVKHMKAKAGSKRSHGKNILLDQNAKPSEQFEFLREIQGVTATAARRIIAHLRDDGQGRGTSKCKRLKFPKVSDVVTTITFGDPCCHMAVTSVPDLLQAKCDGSQFFSESMAYVLKEHGPQLHLVLAWTKQLQVMFCSLICRERQQ